MEKREKDYVFETETWAKGIQNSFNTKPVECLGVTGMDALMSRMRTEARISETKSVMKPSVIYSSCADAVIMDLFRTHYLYKGYFYPRARSP